MNKTLTSLPFPEDALAPIISASTVSHHFNEHHLGYVKKLENLIKATPFAYHPYEEIIAGTRGSCEYCCIFNNAAQAWNHDFFWKSMAPIDCGGKPKGEFLARIERDYGSFASLKRHLIATGSKLFGSGWLWLADFHGRLEAFTTLNAETPAVSCDIRPLFTIDLWEHSYYLDWYSHRAQYIEALLSRLIDWKAASARFANKAIR